MQSPITRIVTVMFENQYRNYVLQNKFMLKLAKAGASLNNYFGVYHPSQTNYVASLAGEVCDVSNDDSPVTPLTQRNLVDIMEEGNVSWKAYMEAYPNEPWNPVWATPSSADYEPPIDSFPNSGRQLARYYRKHNAFASFESIQSSEDRWAKIVDENQFWTDIANDDLPQYSWFTPDIWNDGHYLYNTHIDTNPRTQLIPQLATWLEHVFLGNIKSSSLQGAPSSAPANLGFNLDIDLLLEDPAKAYAQSNIPAGTLIVVTFDEADFDADDYDTNYDGPNQVYTVLLGDMITPGTSIDVPYNHYSHIKTVQQNYGLASLDKNDKASNWFRFLWDEKFAWSDSQASTFQSSKALAVSYINDQYHLLGVNPDGTCYEALYEGESWDNPITSNLDEVRSIQLATLNNELHAVFRDKRGYLSHATSSGDGFWSIPTEMGINSSGSFTMTAYYDIADQVDKLMLCWAHHDGFIQYSIFENGTWGEPSHVNQLTDGPMSLGQLGGSLFLVYKERNTRKMRVTTFNVAPYNSFQALAFNGDPAPDNDTSLKQWSPADMPVGNFAKKMSATQNEYMTLGQMVIASIEGEMHMVYGGAYDDQSTAKNTYFGLTGIFTASNQLTNGFGTINQAGWTKEEAMPEISVASDSPIAMCSSGTELMLVWQDKDSGEIKSMTGGY